MTDFTNLDYLRDVRDLTVVDMAEPSRQHRDDGFRWPHVLIRCGKYAAVIRAVDCTRHTPADDPHLSIDVDPYVNGERATAGVGAMHDGRMWRLGEAPPRLLTTSGPWRSAESGVLVIGEQGWA